jgi:CRISPR-associated protein Csd2
MTATSTTLANRYDFVFLFDVTDGNPNGDPDAGNQPRLDPETGEGLITDVCLKRKVRNFVLSSLRDGNGPKPGYDVFVKERGILAYEQRRAYTENPEKPKASDRTNESARGWMCKAFYDVRAFGAVMTTGKVEAEEAKKYKDNIDPKTKKPQWNCGQVRGPVQFTFARSVVPILALEHAITRVALTNASDVKREGGGGEGEEDKAVSGQFGRKNTVPYGLYRMHGFVSPQLAAQTGFTEVDLTVLWQALVRMFDFDHSATRGHMKPRKLVVFKHDSPLGNAPAHVLFERVQVKPRDGVRVRRSFGDFAVTVDDGNLPAGVILQCIDCDAWADSPIVISAVK